jgi:uncharacterized protein involved in propanediol utilization
MQWSSTVLASVADSGSASCCASFGELLQGMLPDGGHFLATLPIDLHSRARFTVSADTRELSVWPKNSWKALNGVSALLRRFGLPLQGQLRLESEIPRGKGLASSTADLVAALRAVARCYRLPLDVDVLETILRDVEPSDGLMYEGVVAYRHREGRLLARLGPVPALTLVAIDEGGEISTLAHNARRLDFSETEREQYAELLIKLRRALRSDDVAALGAVATRSAQLNQRVLPKRWFDAMTAIADEVQAAGVVAAHSGTYLGIMIDTFGDRHDVQVRRASALIAELGLMPSVFSTTAPVISAHKASL